MQHLAVCTLEAERRDAERRSADKALSTLRESQEDSNEVHHSVGIAGNASALLERRTSARRPDVAITVTVILGRQLEIPRRRRASDPRQQTVRC